MIRARGWIELTPRDRGALDDAKDSSRTVVGSERPLLDGKTVEIESTGLNVDRTGNEIDQQIGLRAGGQLDLFLQNPGRFLKSGAIVWPQVLKRFKFGGGAGGDEKQEQQGSCAEVHGVSAPGACDQKIKIGVPTRASW